MAKGKAVLHIVETGEKGGSGSGNFGHRGIPGKVGGSIPKGSGGGAGGVEIKPVTKSTDQLKSGDKIRMGGETWKLSNYQGPSTQPYRNSDVRYEEWVATNERNEVRVIGLLPHSSYELVPAKLVVPKPLTRAKLNQELRQTAKPKVQSQQLQQATSLAELRGMIPDLKPGKITASRWKFAQQMISQARDANEIKRILEPLLK